LSAVALAGDPVERVADATPVIEVIELTRQYKIGELFVDALRGVSFRITPGEFVAIMGPSGGGKSTLLNLLGCLDRPSSGQYLLDGEDVARLSQVQLARMRRERIGFVFQSFNLLARTSALDNVELPLIYARVDAAERHRRAREALAAVGLEARERHQPTQLSGGEQQRVAIARALVNSPKVLLADEPTGNLDSKSANEILATLQRLNDSGVTVVLVTHEPDIAAYGSRMIRIRDGLVEHDDAVTNRTRAVPAA
jgi:putative ABC transport system ATP-binding protein